MATSSLNAQNGMTTRLSTNEGQALEILKSSRRKPVVKNSKTCSNFPKNGSGPNRSWPGRSVLRKYSLSRERRRERRRRKLKRLQKNRNAETLSTAKIATQVQNAIKQKKKKRLQREFGELKVAQHKSQQMFTTELQKVRMTNAALQEKLDKLRDSHREISLIYEAEILTIRQQADKLQQELKKEVSAHAERVPQDHLVERNLRAEVALHQKMASLTQREPLEQELALQKDMEELTTQLLQLSLNHK